MNKLSKLIVLALTVVATIASSGSLAFASHGGSGTTTTTSSTQSGVWPTAYPLPLNPGVVLSQTSTTATVRSTDTVADVTTKLDTLYVTNKGCASRPAVNKPKDYFCFNASTNKTDEIYFTFAALDVTATNPYHSQTNAFYVKG